MFWSSFEIENDCKLDSSFLQNQYYANDSFNSLFEDIKEDKESLDKEISTHFKSNECQLEKNIYSYDIDNSNIDNSSLDFNSFDSIKETFQKNPKFHKINEKFKKNTYIEIA